MRKLLLASAATMGALLATAGGALAQPVKAPAPGTIAVHLNGYLQFAIGDVGSSFNSFDGYKLNPITTEGDARLYAGVDAQTLSGILYGAQIETRIASSDATKGSNATTGSGSANGVSAVYIRRAYGYIGTKDGGFLRFGQGDPGFTLLQTGVVEAFGDGNQFNSDGGIFSAVPGHAAPSNFVFSDTSVLYATNKLVYLSPSIYGLSAAVSYEPNSNGFKSGYGNNAVASSTSAALAASPNAANIGQRRKNMIDADLVYTMKGDGVLTKIGGGILHAAPIAYDGAAVTTGALKYGYDDLNVYQIGAQTTFAGLTIGANIKAGQTLDGYGFKPKGTRNGFTYIIGADYVVGPYVVGGYVFDGQTAGSYLPGSKTVARTLSEYGVAVGGNYVVGKDMSLFVQYLYGHSHQPGNTNLSPVHGNSQMQAISTGATIKW